MLEKKSPLLFLCHRIPYPPNKGDKIRSWNLFKCLEKKHRIFLGTFVDDKNDWGYVNHVQSLCEKSLFCHLEPKKSKFKSLAGFLKGQPLSVPYYFNSELQQWIKNVVIENKIKQVVVFSSVMAQYVMDDDFLFERKIVDFVDVDSDKWQQYADKKKWPLSKIYQREGRYLLSFDRQVAKQFDSSFFVSAAEASLFKRLAPEAADKVGSYNNGVDSKYFSPDYDSENPYCPNIQTIVFTGAMDYWPNIDGVVWFANEIFPLIRKKFPQLQFFIVGSNPTQQVQQLADKSGIYVTGRVDDIRPYIKHALAAVIPLRIARGIQNKVLEAMAMEKPVIVSAQGLEGIDVENEVLLAEDNHDYEKFIAELLKGGYQRIGADARTLIKSKYNWAKTLSVLEGSLKDNDEQ